MKSVTIEYFNLKFTKYNQFVKKRLWKYEEKKNISFI